LQCFGEKDDLGDDDKVEKLTDALWHGIAAITPRTMLGNG
jgi:hypothetical protein